jgi:hypothetical protein
MIFLVFHYEHLVRLGIIFKLKTCFKKTVFNSILILIYKLIKCAHTESVSVLTAHLLGKEMRLRGLQVVIAQLASGSPRVRAMSESQVLFSIVNRQGTVWLWGFLLASKKIYWWPWINVGLANKLCKLLIYSYINRYEWEYEYTSPRGASSNQIISQVCWS